MQYDRYIYYCMFIVRGDIALCRDVKNSARPTAEKAAGSAKETADQAAGKAKDTTDSTAQKAREGTDSAADTGNKKGDELTAGNEDDSVTEDSEQSGGSTIGWAYNRLTGRTL